MTNSSILPHTPDLRYLAQIIQLAVAPVFLLAGLGAFLNVCAGRLARIVDRIRRLEPRILDSRGEEHDRLLDEVRLLDRRSRIVSSAIFTTVLSALLISGVVILLFLAFLTGYRFGSAIPLLFIPSVICTGAGAAGGAGAATAGGGGAGGAGGSRMECWIASAAANTARRLPKSSSSPVKNSELNPPIFRNAAASQKIKEPARSRRRRLARFHNPVMSFAS